LLTHAIILPTLKIETCEGEETGGGAAETREVKRGRAGEKKSDMK